MAQQAKTTKPRTTKPKHISDVLAAATAEIKADLRPDGKNKKFKYAYASIDEMVTHVRDVLVKHKLVPHMNRTHSEVIYREFLNEDRNHWVKVPWQIYAVYEMWFTWGDQKSERESFGQTMPFGKDQSVGALRSYIYKDWLKRKFLLVTGDPDLDASTNTGTQPKRQPQGQTRPVNLQQNAQQEAEEQNRKFEERQKVYEHAVKVGVGDMKYVHWMTDNITYKGWDDITDRDMEIIKRFFRLVQLRQPPAPVKPDVDKAIEDLIPVANWIQSQNIKE